MKYKILENEFILHYDRKLFRIQALKDFGLVQKDDLGGWVESYTNLSQSGNCWIFHDARVYDNAEVFGNSLISKSDDFYVFKLSGRHLTFCKDSELGVNVTVGCKKAISLEYFKELIYSDGCYRYYEDLPKHRQEYLAVIDLVEKFMLNYKRED